MHRVTSADGTRIAFDRHGDGPPLVLLHGSSGSHESFDALVPHLADSFTLLVPDRRGRGESGDADEYSLDREIEDLRAVVDAADGQPAVLGHSFGGLVALAGAADLPIDRLVLYEPALLVGEHREEDDLADRMQARYDEGDHQGAMALFVEVAGDVDDATQLDWWPADANIDRVDTVIRENYAVESYRLPDDPGIDVPTLLLTGEHGPDHLRDAVFTLDERLPDSRLVELDGVGHVATDSAPDRVALEVHSFLDGETDAG